MGIKKKCNTCKDTKSIKHFYAQKCGLLGRTGSCKDCRKTYQVKYNSENKEKRSEAGKVYSEKHREKNRERHQCFKKNNPDYWKEYYKQNKEIRLAANKRFYDKNPERRVFYSEYKKALNKGILVRPNQCCLCGVIGKIVGHHFNYDDPMKVTWVCEPCHHEIHRKHKFTHG
tara:strand:- start:642 stop:1157 length:516 start_codon:yes stop_codon:yes gene_type:complete